MRIAFALLAGAVLLGAPPLVSAAAAAEQTVAPAAKKTVKRAPKKSTVVKGGAAAAAAAATAEAEAAGTPAQRTRLKGLYAVSVLGDRCGFPISTAEGALLDKNVGAMEKTLKLTDQQADALYSEVDVALEGKGREKLCASAGEDAKAFRATLDGLKDEDGKAR